MDLVRFTNKGIYCERAGIYIDPWRPVKKAVVTHAHSDHSRPGMKSYLAHHLSVPVMKHRLGDIRVEGVGYGQDIEMNGVKISLHPAGHVPGSSQIRLSYKGETWVITGDYKTTDDGISTPFEPVKCTHLVTESTFGLPVYRWPDQKHVMEEIRQWWNKNREEGFNSILLGYAFGKAQRILHYFRDDSNIFIHGAIHQTNLALEKVGIHFPNAQYADPGLGSDRFHAALIIAPPSVLGSSWLNRFKPFRVSTASGWMALRGPRRRRNVDKGFILSDHADWDGLNHAVSLSEADHVYVTHGYTGVFTKWLNDLGYDANAVKTEFEGELSEIGESSQGEKEEG